MPAPSSSGSPVSVPSGTPSSPRSRALSRWAMDSVTSRLKRLFAAVLLVIEVTRPAASRSKVTKSE